MSFSLDWQAERHCNTVMEVCESAVFDGAKKVKRRAEDKCPVESVESVQARSTSEKVKQYGAAAGALKKSGRIVKFRKKGIVGAYVQFGGITVDGVDTYYGPFVELGTPGTTFKTPKGYFGHKAGQRVSVEASPFLRPGLKASGGDIKKGFKGKLK